MGAGGYNDACRVDGSASFQGGPRAGAGYTCSETNRVGLEAPYGAPPVVTKPEASPPAPPVLPGRPARRRGRRGSAGRWCGPSSMRCPGGPVVARPSRERRCEVTCPCPVPTDVRSRRCTFARRGGGGADGRDRKALRPPSTPVPSRYVLIPQGRRDRGPLSPQRGRHRHTRLASPSSPATDSLILDRR